MKSLMCGPEGTFHQNKVYDFSPEEAKQLLSGGFAEKVKQNVEVEIETATVKAPENTALRVNRKRRRPQVRTGNESQTDNGPDAGASDAGGSEESSSDRVE
jgi:hypothetical protein